MKKTISRQEQLELVQKRTAELERKLGELDRQIDLEQKQYELAKQEHERLESEFHALKQSRIWKLVSIVVQVKRNGKLLAKVITGKRSVRDVFSRTHQQKQAVQRVKKVKYSLYELGFTNKALAELENLCLKSDNPYIRKQAAWELALWHANQYDEASAKKCLEMLERAAKKETAKQSLRRIAVLKAESYDLLGEVNKAKQVIDEVLTRDKHIDLYFARASLEASQQERLNWINQGLSLKGITLVMDNGTKSGTLYDRLTTATIDQDQVNQQDIDQHKVTVIIPAYNAATSIQTALDSVLAQTWSNLEVIVADDCSMDETKAIVQDYMNKDPRVQLISNERNSGAYTSRNNALKIATGEFVTINDADDWSHPKKIEEQVRHLLQNESVVANTSEQARATEELKFYRRGKPGEYVFANMSSLMFRRKPAMDKLGYWDCVRFGADGEFKKRLRLVFGKDAVVDLKTGPYSFQRQSEGSLTGNQAFGYHGFFMGARKEYTEVYENHHKSGGDLYYPFPQTTRPYPVPEPMWPEREEKVEGRRHFDVIIASEFRLLGGTNMSNVEEIKAQKQMGLRTGLIQMARYDLRSVKELNPRVRELVDGEQVAMLVYGEKVSCDVLIVRHPPILQEWQKYIPDVRAKHVRVIVNQPPKREYSEKGTTLYTIDRCAKHLKEYYGATGIWYPIGPSIRETLHEHHADELKSITLADEDWVNIIDVNEWKRSERPHKGGTIRIGRHSRDQYVKWPDTKDELLTIYPDSEPYEIHVLGGAKAPKKVLDELPGNWHVYEFGELHPKDFLAKLDVFIYYTHPKWVEAFGRVIFEAMAAGVPVIIPPSYEPLFGEAAIYAEPNEVISKVDELMGDRAKYEVQVEKAQVYVEHHFGYTKHASRLAECFLETNSLNINK